jgi:hypothetical protein
MPCINRSLLPLDTGASLATAIDAVVADLDVVLTPLLSVDDDVVDVVDAPADAIGVAFPPVMSVTVAPVTLADVDDTMPLLLMFIVDFVVDAVNATACVVTVATGVGAGVGFAVVGSGVGDRVVLGVGEFVAGTGVGAIVDGTGVGAGVGTGVGAGVGTGVGESVGGGGGGGGGALRTTRVTASRSPQATYTVGAGDGAGDGAGVGAGVGGVHVIVTSKLSTCNIIVPLVRPATLLFDTCPASDTCSPP